MTQKVLILQARPEDAAADAEFDAILRSASLDESNVQRVRLERDEPPAPDALSDFSAIILGGGPGCVSDAPEKKTAPEALIEERVMALMPSITGQDLPFMGCCLGIGILGAHLGPHISKEKYSEKVGIAHCAVTDDGASDPLLQGVNRNFDAFVGHKEAMQDLPDGCVHLVEAPSCPFQMVRYGQNVYATQFHPEADGAEFELRIRMYRDRGYFAPEEADDLIALCQSADVTQPEIILRNFIKRYA